jgi:transcriptional regulator with XRE-family HTH domain
MARDVEEIIDSLPAARRRRIEQRSAALIAEELTLQELRRARSITQTRLARSLGVAQKQISEVERRTDMHISTLRRSIEAMGGRLYLIAEFPDRAPVRLSGIASIEGQSDTSRPTARVRGAPKKSARRRRSLSLG